jgi:hypothetical protein
MRKLLTAAALLAALGTTACGSSHKPPSPTRDLPPVRTMDHDIRQDYQQQLDEEGRGAIRITSVACVKDEKEAACLVIAQSPSGLDSTTISITPLAGGRYIWKSGS